MWGFSGKLCVLSPWADVGGRDPPEGQVRPRPQWSSAPARATGQAVDPHRHPPHLRACVPGGQAHPIPPWAALQAVWCLPLALLSDSLLHSTSKSSSPGLEGGDFFPPLVPTHVQGWACWKQRETHIPGASPLAPLGLGPQPHLYLIGSYKQASRWPPTLGSPSVCESEGAAHSGN